tara:strand:+ start:2184 stop:2318 length:135 start_codon:yes stop_codon:yes gene_type:complete
MKEQILTKFSKESYEKIVSKAKEQGLPKSTWLRYIALKSISEEL